MFKRIADIIPLAVTLAAAAAILLLPNAARGSEVVCKSWAEATSEPAPIARITVTANTRPRTMQASVTLPSVHG